MNILEAIKIHGLSIRQIPESVTSHLSLHNIKEGDEIVEFELKDNLDYIRVKFADSPHYRFDVSGKIFRLYKKEVRIPKHAGHWMCQKVTGTSSTVSWNIGTCNLAPTLEGSVEAFLAAYLG